MNGGGSAAQGIYAVGTFEGKVAVFSENVMDKSKPITPILQGPRLGVSQLGFVTPASGVTPWYLVAGGRADGSVSPLFLHCIFLPLFIQLVLLLWYLVNKTKSWVYFIHWDSKANCITYICLIQHTLQILSDRMLY